VDTFEGPADNRRQNTDVPRSDMVEFFLTFGSTHFFWELHHSVANNFNDALIVVPDRGWKISKSSMAGPGIMFLHGTYLEDDGEYKFAKAVALLPKADGKPSTVNTPGDQDAGYTGEIRIPWLAIGAPNKAKTRTPGTWNMAGQTITILAIVQNCDSDDRYMHSCPTAPKKGQFFHMSADQWTVFKLEDGE
jgi:hypothetical protein